MVTTGIEIVPVTTRELDLLSALFATSRGVNGCWCMWPLRPPLTHRPDEKGNKAALQALIESRRSPGLIGVAQGRAVGWCAVGPRRRYPQYADTGGPGEAWAVPCIYIRPTADRPAVAHALLDAAAELAKANGAAVLDGPPPWWLPGDAAAIALATQTFVETGFVKTGAGARMPELKRMLR